MSFSVKIDSSYLEDFLSPGQACIKPKQIDSSKRLKGVTEESTADDMKDNTPPAISGRVELDIDMDSFGGGHFNQIRDVRSKANVEDDSSTAKITLNDCLACSGCVTSAETLLITAQSAAQFLTQLKAAADDGNSAKRINIVTIGPQPLTALAHRYHLSDLQMYKKLTTYLHSLGVQHVVDTTGCLDISLLECQHEFVERFRRQKGDILRQYWQMKQQLSGDELKQDVTQAMTDSDSKEDSSDALPLPVISSECPGWVCLAEKREGSYIVPYMSNVKSPQQITGSLLKSYYSQQLGVPPSAIYHTTIMPCYDKKLEAVRPEFHVREEEYITEMEVDCVLATSEVQNMIEKGTEDGSLQPVDIAALADSPLHPLLSSTNTEQTVLYRPLDEGSSGGYAENVFRCAAKQLFDITISPQQKLPWQIKQTTRAAAKRAAAAGESSNAIRELTLSVSEDGKPLLNATSANTTPLLRFALAYGLANLKNVTDKVKKSSAGNLMAQRSMYDYVEMMACPSGCMNGGGQLTADNIEVRSTTGINLPVTSESAHAKDRISMQKHLVLQLKDKYHNDRAVRPTADAPHSTTNPIVKLVYGDWLRTTVGSATAQKHFHTHWHALSADEDGMTQSGAVNPLTAQW